MGERKGRRQQHRSIAASGGVAAEALASAARRPSSLGETRRVCAEIARLRRENERLRMERDILKRGIAIFANPSR